MSEKRNHKIYNPKMECMSRDERAALQSERLRELVRREYDHVEVYRRRMDDKGVRPEDIRTIEDIRLLPFMEKTDLRDQWPFGLFAVPKRDIVRIQGSSGTTGHPIVSGYTQHDLDVWSEMMARTLELDMAEMSRRGLTWDKELTISSMCTVFAESEVISLIADNHTDSDIIHGLNKSIAGKTAAMAARAKGQPPYMMTGGVARNRGVVQALEEKLGAKLLISENPDLCGALGAALFALHGD